ncbi:unnamed protein product [Coffea canephora]|uniref:Uncharacterized protein n=2 Tax=Coffea TaxID=13442 RepID=A0A068UQU4_COFCA|nr:unnamed protein product [Coffea canephora]
MAPDRSPSRKSSAASTSRSGGSLRHIMKKGPWTANEDALLMEYVRKNGEGNWNAVQRNSGLMRCGKSCRLRWSNHLRPNLKKGAFTQDEEALIVNLHAKFGNKWARMASQLPGRTDNEIKNYWNTRLKRRQRAGLPVYPVDIQPLNQYQPQNLQPSPSLVSFITAVDGKPKHSTPISIFDMFNPTTPPAPTFQNQPMPSFLSDPSPNFKPAQNKNGIALSLSSVNSLLSLTSASLAFNNQGPSPLGASLPMPSLQFNCLNFGIANTVPVSHASFAQNDTGSGSSMGLPAIQSLVPETTSSGSDYMIATSSDADDRDEGHDHQGLSHGNSGLLEDVIDESQALTRAEKPKETCLDAEKSQGEFLWDYKLMEDVGGNVGEESGLNAILDEPFKDSTPTHSSIGVETTNASSLKSNPVEDDLFNLLDDIPLPVTMPDWYDGNGNDIDGQCSNWTGGDAGKENHQPEPSYSPVATTPEITDNNWTDGASYWKNLPGIY